MQKVTKLPEWQVQWQRCKPIIEKAIKHQSAYTIDDIEDKIREGIFLLWAGKQSAFITEFITFPQEIAMNLLFCGGKYEELEEMLDSIIVFAKGAGATKLYGGGRPGWKRKLKHCGFKTENIISKDI